MSKNLTESELKEIGINIDNLKYPMGEMNVIVQNMPCYDDDTNELMSYLKPDIYHPRKNSVYSCGAHDDIYDMTDEDVKKEFITHLKDSAERLKIMAYKLLKQADELEKDGFITTSLYYPE